MLPSFLTSPKSWWDLAMRKTFSSISTYLCRHRKSEEGRGNIEDTEVEMEWNRTYLFFKNKPQISNLSPWLPLPRCYGFFFLPLSLSLSVAVSVLYLHLSPALCSGSGSGNRSVTCHYWSNSVIRHRALTVCSALYASTAGVLRTEVEIRFDTHTQAREPTGAGADGHRMCVFVCVHFVFCVSEKVEGEQIERWRNWIFVCMSVDIL